MSEATEPSQPGASGDAAGTGGTGGRWDGKRFGEWATEAARTGQTYEAIPAATVILLRDTPDGIETLMLHRNAALAFVGGGWVFPGGRVDPEDYAPDASDGRDTPEAHFLAARTAAVREAEEEAGLLVDPDRCVFFAHWVPPPMAPKRFATYFFMAPAPTADSVTVDGGEIHNHAWMRPADVLDRHRSGEIDMVPPTWVTLFELAKHDTVASAIAHATAHEPRYFETHIGRVEGGGVALWAGDAGYETSDADAPGPRHRLHMLSTGWWYERTV
jgi:8-oxo-dGTP pyrophosphatase MutT (NUDIX family)